MDTQEAIAAMQKSWKNQRRFAGNVFAGLEKLKAFPYGKDMTNSARSTFLNCRRKYQYSYVFGLAPRRPSIPFLVGGLFHDALDRFYTEGRLDLDKEKMTVTKACEKASHSEGLTPEESDKVWIQSAIVMGLLHGYIKQHGKADLASWEIIQAEGAFDVELPNGWRYRGKTDLVVRDKKSKRVKLVEHKTTGRLDASYVAKLPLDNQILGYIWAKNKEKLGIKEVVYNVARKPGIRQKQAESLAQFSQRIRDEYMLNTASYFYRETLVFQESDVERFAAELSGFMSEIDRSIAKDFFYQNTGQCTAFNTPCPFMKLCLDGVNDETLPLYRIKERAHEELPDEAE